MAKLILILGDLAAGKSTLAKKISHEKKILCLVKDTLKEILSDEIGFSNRAENKKLSNASIAVMKQVFCDYAILNNDLILEANFHKEEIEYFFFKAQELACEFYCIFLTGNDDLLFSRFEYRIKYENRHPTHKTSDIMTKEGFFAYLEKSRQEVFSAKIPKITLHTIQVEAQNYEEVYKDALNFLF